MCAGRWRSAVGLAGPEPVVAATTMPPASTLTAAVAITRSRRMPPVCDGRSCRVVRFQNCVPKVRTRLDIEGIRTYVRIMHEFLDRLAMVEHFGAEEAATRAAEADRIYAPVRGAVAELLSTAPDATMVSRLVELQSVPMDPATGIEFVAAWDRALAWMQAQRMSALSIATSADPDPFGWVTADLAATSHVSEYAAARDLSLTRRVGDALPQTWLALNAGTITLDHLTAMDGPTRLLRVEHAQHVEAEVLPQALAEGWTPGELREAARQAALKIDPAGAEERCRRAQRERSDVKAYADEDGIGSLVATGSGMLTRQMMDEVNRRADERKRAGDPRRLGEVRFAVMTELVTGRSASVDTATGEILTDVPPSDTPRPTPRRTQGFVTVDLPTLLGLCDNPGEISGLGPVPAQMARMVAKDAKLRLLVLGPHGRPVSLGRTSYELSAEMRRFIDARDRECLFPGCHKRAVYCDADHCVEYDAGGETSCDNCGLLCRRHHNFKTSKAWDYVRHDDDSVTWTSPFGHTFHVRPRPYYVWDGYDETCDPAAGWDEDADDDSQVIALADRDPHPPDTDVPVPDPPPPADDDEIEDDWWNRMWLRSRAS